MDEKRCQLVIFSENLTKQIPDEIEERDGSASGAAEPIVALPVHVGASGVDPDDDDVYHDGDDDVYRDGDDEVYHDGDDDVYHDGGDDGESDYDGDLRSFGGASQHW